MAFVVRPSSVAGLVVAFMFMLSSPLVVRAAEGEGQQPGQPADQQKQGDAWDTAIKQGMHQEGRPTQSQIAEKEREKDEAGDEYETRKKVGLGGDLMLLVPVGDLSESAGVMIGPVLRGGYRVIPQLELTGRIGYLFGLEKETFRGNLLINYGLNILPIWGGARFFFMKDQAPAGFYAVGELGANVLSARVTLTSGGSTRSDSNTEPRFGTNFGAGYVISREVPIDLRLGMSLINLFDGSDLAYGIGFSAGYTYQL